MARLRPRLRAPPRVIMFVTARVSAPITVWAWASWVVSLCIRSRRTLATPARGLCGCLPGCVPSRGTAPDRTGRQGPTGPPLAGGLAVQRPQYLPGPLQLRRGRDARDLGAVRGSDHDEVFHPGIEPDHAGTGPGVGRPPDAALHQAGERHQPAAPLEPDGGTGDPRGPVLDPPGELAGGLVGLDLAQPGQRHMRA